MLSIFKIFSIINDKIPTRFNVGVMIFMTCFMSYMLRVNMSINILGMSEPLNKSETDVPNYGPRYNWSGTQQSLLLGGYFWGSFMTTLAGGILSEWFGGKWVVGLALAISTALTVLTPLAAEWSFWAIYLNRIMLGTLGGLLYPSMHNLVSKWAPPDEKGKFVSALLGGALGTAVTWPMCGFLMEFYGWAFSFYVPAMMTMLVTIAWFILVADTPNSHPRIRADEREYIATSMDGNLSEEKAIPPYFKLMTSLPFIALIVLHFGNLWGLFFLLTAAPKFMSEALGFNLAAAGVFASLPSLARLLSGFVFGSIGDQLRQKNVMSVTMMRKVFCIFSHIIPGLLLMSIAYFGDYPYVCVAIVTTSLGSNGAAAITNLQNSQDLAPNFAGTLYSIINFVATSSGFISPLVVGYFTRERNTIDEWSIVFTIGGLLYITSAIFFWIFGSGEVQPWNEILKKPAIKDGSGVC